MIRNVFKPIFFICIFALSVFCAKAQTTVDFNSYDENLGLPDPHEEGELEFETVKNGASCTSCIGIDKDLGKDGTAGLDDQNFNPGGITGWKISKADNSSFQFLSIWLQERGIPFISTSGTIKAFKGGLQVGSTVNIDFNSESAGLKSFSSNPDFYDVDYVLIEGADLFMILDEITYDDPFIVGAADPTEVTGINLVGSPLSTATSVTYQVDFSKTAVNVSSNDFVLTTTGTAAGTVGTVSGSGASYSVAVNGIAGEGTIRLDLIAGTDIENENGIDGTAAYTSGQIHNVSPCLVEDFEDETVGSKTFSYGGFDFTITGNLEVYTESPPIGINGSNNVLKNTGTGTYTISLNSGEINLRKIAIFLSSEVKGDEEDGVVDPTDDGNITVVGKNGGATVYTISKASGFPTGYSANSGYYIFDFRTEGGMDNSDVSVDEIEISLGGAFIYMNIDNFEFCADNVAPSGYTVSIDQDPITLDNDDAVSFTFANAEIGTTYEYTFTSSGGGTPVISTGTILTATDQITGIDLSGLGLGTITLSVNLTDGSSNEGLPATDNVLKRTNTAPVATAPSAPVVTEDEVNVALADDIQVADADGDDQTVTFTITGGTVTLGTTGITFGGSGNGSASFTAAGTLAALNTALDAATFTPTPDLFGTGVATIEFVSNDGTADSNTASVTFDITGVNDAPAFDGNRVISYTEGGTAAKFNGGGNIGLSDIEGDDIIEAKITFNDKIIGDVLSVEAPSPYSVTQEGDVITLLGTGSVAQMIAALESIEYSHTGNDPTVGGTDNSRNISILVKDASSLSSNSLVVQVSLTGINDDPTMSDLPSDISVVENTASNIDLSGATFGDVDSGSGNVRLSFLVSSGTLSATSGSGVTVTFPIPGAVNLEGTAAAIESFLNTPSNIQYTNALGSTGDNAATLSVSATDNGNTGDGGGTTVNLGVINIDVESFISFSINDPAVTEGDAGTTSLQFTVSLSAPAPAGGATVDFATSDGTATAGSDYTGISTTTLSFLAGESSKTVNVTVVGDQLVELDETLTLTLSNPTGTNVIIADATGTGTITNDDQAAVTIADVSGNEDDGPITVTVNLDNAVDGGFSVDLNTADGTATTADSDYTAVTSQTLTFAGTAGETQTFTVTPTADTKLEADETVSVSMSNLAGTTLPVTITDGATVSILNDDPFPNLNIDNISVNENEGSATFTVTLSAVSDLAVSIDYVSSDGTAIAGSDYTAVLGTLNFAAGDLIKTIVVPIINDGIFEDSENFSINLSNPTNAILETIAGIGTILNDDPEPKIIALGVQHATEGLDLICTVTLDQASGTPLTMSYSIGGGTASPSDYGTPVFSDGVAVVGTNLLIPAGISSFRVVVPTVDDLFNEATETVPFTFNGLRILGNIYDNDVQPGLFINSISFNENSGTVVFTVSLSVASGQLVSVNYSSADGTATAGSDYTAVSGTLNFAAGELTQTISVPIIDDSDFEVQENFTITLSGATNASIINATGTGTIIDNDSAPIVSSISSPEVIEGEDLIYNVTLSNASTTNTSFSFALGGGSASNSDYGTPSFSNGVSLVAGNLIVPAFVTSFSLTLPTIDDDFFEPSETVPLNIGGLISTGTILNNDPAILTITANENQSKVLGATDPVLTFTASGFEGTDDATILTGALSRDPGETVGTYAINQGDLSAGPNYTIIFVPADFEIKKGTVQITGLFDAADKVYDATKSATLSVNNLSLSGIDANSPDVSIGTVTTEFVDKNVGVGKEVIITSINLTGADASSYDIDYTGAPTSTATISAASLSVVGFSSNNKVYDGTTSASLSGTPSVTGIAADDVSVTGTPIANFLQSDVGVAIPISVTGLTLDGLDKDNYVIIPPAGLEANITEAQLLISANPNQSKEFGSADPIFTYSSSGFVGVETHAILTGALSRTAGEDKGTYPINLGTLDAGSNYSINFIGANFTIAAKVLNITADAGQMKVYGEGDPIFTYVATGFEAGDDESILTGALARAAGENVGNYAINLGTLSAGNNYTINFTSADFEITKATLNITADAGQTKVYGNADPTYSFTATGFEGGDDESILTGALTRVVGEDVGTYAINLGTLDAGANYTINFTSADFEITPATLDITADAGQSKIYGDADPVFTYAVNGFENGDTQAVLTGSLSRVAGENVGFYAIQPGTIDAGGNYTINFTPADFEITKAALTVIANSGISKIYGNVDPTLTYQATGFKNGDTQTILSGTLARAAGENVGNYAISVGTLSAGANYTINFTGANFAITPRTLNVTANPNQAKVYGSADPVLAYSASNFGNGDTNAILTGALSRTAGENIGMYPINLGTLSAGSNYTINFTSADFEIAAKVLNVTAEAGQSKVFGTADPILTYTATGFENGDTNAILTGALSRAAGENVGNYAINLGTLSAGANYAINFVGADFAITKAMITGITLADGSFVYDGTSKSLAISGSLPAGTSVAYTNNSRTDVGTQEVTATISGSNYTTLVLTADLSITPAVIAGITFEDGSFVYDGTSKSLAITGTLPTGASVAYTGNSRTEVGMQEVTVTISGSNFTELELTADLTITPAILTVSADAGQSKLFGAADPELTFAASGFGEGDDESLISGTLSRAAGEAVGLYAISIGTLDAGDNYTIDFTGAEFEIISTDTDGDGVPDDIENEQGTDPTDPMDYQDQDGDGVPDYVEDEQGTDPSDPGDYLDTDGDDVPDYVEEQQGTDPNDITDFPDVDEDGIPDYVQARSVIEFVTQSMEALWGTESGDLKVPTEAVVITASGEFINLPVIWDLTGYDPMMAGTTTYMGTVDLPAGLFNPDELQPMLEITVLAKPAPQDVTLSANSFIGIPDQYFQEIGAFTVIDPTDNVHTLSLPEGVQDNEYFEVLDGILFWSSAEQAQGRTEFTVLLRVEDRGGNVLEKSFQITRTRTPLDQLDVPNTFTPNGDGSNDTWGVIALRYYTGVKISIMAVGGERVFYTENPDKQWDGIFNGKEMPVGAYLYVIEVAETGEIRRGMLNLLRH